MGICLMSDIPYQFILRCMKDIMKGHGEFHCPKSGAKMTACFRNTIDQILSHLGTKYAKVLKFQPAQIFRKIN